MDLTLCICPHLTLCARPQDEDRTKVAMNEVLSWHELNKQLARSPEELALFDRCGLVLLLVFCYCMMAC